MQFPVDQKNRFSSTRVEQSIAHPTQRGQLELHSGRPYEPRTTVDDPRNDRGGGGGNLDKAEILMQQAALLHQVEGDRIGRCGIKKHNCICIGSRA